MTDDVLKKLSAIYGALELNIKRDISDAKVEALDGIDFSRGLIFDPAQGMSQDSTMVLIEALVHQIASLKDYCKKWFRKHSLDPKLVEECIDKCRDLAILIDLDNYLKHGDERPGTKTRSGIFPRLKDVTWAMGSPMNSGISIFPGTGEIEVEGQPSFEIVADIVSRDGQRIGFFPYIQCEAVNAWETLLRSHGFLK